MPAYTVTRIGSIEGAYATEASLAVLPDGSAAATATRDQHGLVQLTVWNLLAGGAIQQHSQMSVDPQAGPHVAAIGPGEYVTAGESTQGGHVKAIFWRNGASTGEGSAAEGHTVSITAFPFRFALIGNAPPPPPGTNVIYAEGYLVATASVTNNHKLRVTSWFAGVQIVEGIDTLAAANGAETVTTSIAPKSTVITNTNLSSADVVTGAIGQGKLHLGTWRLHVEAEQSPSVEHVHGAITSESANEVAIATYPPGQSTNLVAALITPAGNFKLIGWQMNDDGSFTKGLNVIGETASEVCCAYVTGSIVVTAFKTSSSHFKLIYWQFPASPSDSQAITQIAEVDGGAIPYDGLSVGHWRAQNAPAADLGETLLTCIANSGALKLIRFHLTSS